MNIYVDLCPVQVVELKGQLNAVASRAEGKHILNNLIPCIQARLNCLAPRFLITSARRWPFHSKRSDVSGTN